jgi:predicted RNA-binding Zn-ribbon protein involved in translation (DUF1610 family)
VTRDGDNASDSTDDNASDSDGDSEAEFTCDDCGEQFDRDRGIRSAPMGDLDTTQWQRFDCPNCGRRVKTVFLGD